MAVIEYTERLVLPYPVSVNRYWRNVRGMMVISKEAAQYKAYVRKAAMLERSKMLSVPVAIEVELKPWKRLRRMDLDNCLKVVIDALQGVAYEKDSSVVDIHAFVGEPVQGGGLVVAWGALV